MRIGDLVTPHGNVPRVGEIGTVTAVTEISGMTWCDIRFERPHALHGSRMEGVGADWLRRVDNARGQPQHATRRRS